MVVWRRGDGGERCCIDCVLEIITRILREVVNRERLYGTRAFYFSGSPSLCSLYACMLGFYHTLEIIARTLREVVNRERLCGTIAFYLFVCLFVCLDKTRTFILRSLCLEGSNNPWEWLHTDPGTDHVRETKTAA